jgi:hypothetical protein
MFNLFKTPYLDAPTDGGGGNPAPSPEPNPNPTPAPQGGDPAPAPEPQRIKVKYNHEELDLPYEEAVTHIQKGMNYDKAVERAKQEARDTYIAEQNYSWNGKPIKTEAEYRQALREQELVKQYQARGLPEEVVDELLQNRKFREEYQAKEKTFQEKERREKDYTEFDEWHTKTFGKVANPEDIPPEVWEAVKQGVSMKHAFMEHSYSGINSRISELEAKLQTQQANDKNAANSTGSVKTSGALPQGFISKEDYVANKSDPRWVQANHDTLVTSMKHWK